MCLSDRDCSYFECDSRYSRSSLDISKEFSVEKLLSFTDLRDNLCIGLSRKGYHNVISCTAA